MRRGSASATGRPEAFAPCLRAAITTAPVPAVDQTRSIRLVTLPGTFVGLLHGVAAPARAAATQLVILLALLAVELLAVELVAALLVATGLPPRADRPGDRLELPGAPLS